MIAPVALISVANVATEPGGVERRDDAVESPQQAVRESVSGNYSRWIYSRSSKDPGPVKVVIFPSGVRK